VPNLTGFQTCQVSTFVFYLILIPKHHRGKEDLISHLNQIIPSLSKRAQQIIVIIDRDKQDCVALKNNIKEKMVWCSCEHKIRIACYELEAWFLGDMKAIAKCSHSFKAPKPQFFSGFFVAMPKLAKFNHQ